MAIGRMLNKTVGLDRELNSVSVEAQLLFLMSIPHLDRDGLIIGEALPHLGTVLPLRPELFPKYEEIVGELVDVGIVIRYPTKKGRVLFFPGFRKNQNFSYGKEGKSIFEPPPGYVRTSNGLEFKQVTSNSGATPEQLQSNSGVTPEQVQSNSGVTPEQVQSNSGVTPEQRTLKLSKDKLSKDKSSQVKSQVESDNNMGARNTHTHTHTLSASQPSLNTQTSEYRDAVRAYEQVVGLPITKPIGDDLADWIEVLGPNAGWVADAIREATGKDKPWPYAQAILRNWQTNGRPKSNGRGDLYAPDPDRYVPDFGDALVDDPEIRAIMTS